MTTRSPIAKTVAAAALMAACALGAQAPASAQALCTREPREPVTSTTRPGGPNTRSLDCNGKMSGSQGTAPSVTTPPTTTTPPTSQSTTTTPPTSQSTTTQPQSTQPTPPQPGGRGSSRPVVVERAQPAQAEVRDELPVTGDHTGQLTALGLGLIAAGASASVVARRRMADSL